MIEAEDILRLCLGETRRRAFLAPKETAADERTALHIAQMISAMANADGGHIYAGMSLKRKKAAGLYHFQPFPPQWIEQVAAEHISPTVPGLIVQVLELQAGPVLRITVPKSPAAPHRCSDKQYYTKETSGIRALEEYDIRKLYLRASQPEIEVWAVQNTSGIPQLSQGKYSIVNFYPKLMVKNTGNAAEPVFKIELAVPTAINNQNFDVLQKYFSRFEDGYTVYSYASVSPLFPDEVALVFEANLFVHADNYAAFEQGLLQLKVYYTHGFSRKDFRLKDLLTYRHEPLELPQFAQYLPD